MTISHSGLLFLGHPVYAFYTGKNWEKNYEPVYGGRPTWKMLNQVPHNSFMFRVVE